MPANDTRMQWWCEARFGMFIHWDMSSVAGTEISWSSGATKPLDIYGHKGCVSASVQTKDMNVSYANSGGNQEL